jgi:hypothetical protein
VQLPSRQDAGGNQQNALAAFVHIGQNITFAVYSPLALKGKYDELQ